MPSGGVTTGGHEVFLGDADCLTGTRERMPLPPGEFIKLLYGPGKTAILSITRPGLAQRYWQERFQLTVRVRCAPCRSDQCNFSDNSTTAPVLDASSSDRCFDTRSVY